MSDGVSWIKSCKIGLNHFDHVKNLDILHKTSECKGLFNLQIMSSLTFQSCICRVGVSVVFGGGIVQILAIKRASCFLPYTCSFLSLMCCSSDTNAVQLKHNCAAALSSEPHLLYVLCEHGGLRKYSKP